MVFSRVPSPPFFLTRGKNWVAPDDSTPRHALDAITPIVATQAHDLYRKASSRRVVGWFSKVFGGGGRGASRRRVRRVVFESFPVGVAGGRRVVGWPRKVFFPWCIAVATAGLCWDSLAALGHIPGTSRLPTHTYSQNTPTHLGYLTHCWCRCLLG